jgi:phosphoribosylformylglycinamidine synthase
MQLAEEFNVADMPRSKLEEDSYLLKRQRLAVLMVLMILYVFLAVPELQQAWTQVSYQIARRRDNRHARKSMSLIADASHQGLMRRTLI